MGLTRLLTCQKAHACIWEAAAVLWHWALACPRGSLEAGTDPILIALAQLSLHRGGYAGSFEALGSFQGKELPRCQLPCCVGIRE